MPTTRAMKKLDNNVAGPSKSTLGKESRQPLKKLDSENTLVKEVNTGSKRKYTEGRKILGEIDNKNNKNNILRNRKILAPRLNNKNVPTGSETLKNRRAGLKESAVDYVNSLKKSLTGLKDSKQPRREIEKPKFYTGHDQNCIIPFSQSRIEVRDDLIRQNKFFNYEDSVKNQLIESSDFAMGIFEYMKWREERFEMQPYFGSTGKIKQTGFTPSDRKRLIDWMVEFQEIQESTHETLYLAIRLCDYFFGHKQVSRKELQLVAFVGFLLAAKFEERWPPLFEDMIQISDNEYDADDFIRVEQAMLKVLNFDINIPISYRYLRRYSKCIGMNMQCLTVARFYLELTLMEYEFIFESQSNMAAACLWIAMNTLQFDSESRQVDIDQSGGRFLKKYWSDQLTFYVGVNEWDILPLVKKIAACVRKTQHELRAFPTMESDDEEYDPRVYERYQNTCHTIYKKYASSIFYSVALRPILSESDMECHMRRVRSEKIDYEAVNEPNSKRRSTGCTKPFQKMTLRSTTPTIPEKPLSQSKSSQNKNKIYFDNSDSDVEKSNLENSNTAFYSCESTKKRKEDEIYCLDDEDKENSDLNVVASQ